MHARQGTGGLRESPCHAGQIIVVRHRHKFVHVARVIAGEIRSPPSNDVSKRSPIHVGQSHVVIPIDFVKLEHREQRRPDEPAPSFGLVAELGLALGCSPDLASRFSRPPVPRSVRAAELSTRRLPRRDPANPRADKGRARARPSEESDLGCTETPDRSQARIDRGGSLLLRIRTNVSTTTCLSPRTLPVLIAPFIAARHRSSLGFGCGCGICAAIMELTR